MRRAGFTLIELLVVLLIVSVLTSIALLAFQHFGRARREKMAIAQFQNKILLAEQRAILQPAVLGLVWRPQAYVFYRYEQDARTKKARWSRLSEDHLSASAVNLGVWRLIPDGKQQLKSIFRQSTFISPRIVFFPNGDVTPFILRVESRNVLRVSRTGQIRLIPHEKR